MCVCVCTGKSDDGDAHDAALPFHKLAGEPSLFSFFFFFSLYSMCVCVLYVSQCFLSLSSPSHPSPFSRFVSILLLRWSPGVRHKLSTRRRSYFVSLRGVERCARLAPAAADASTAAAAQLGTLDGGQPTLLDPAAVYISIYFFSLSFRRGGPARKCPSFSSFFLSFLFVFSVVLIPSLFTRKLSNS